VIVVSDSSPLIALASLGRLELLHALYGSVLIPEAVRDEVSVDINRPGAREVLAAGWIEVRQSRDTLERVIALTLVDKGEAEAIGLAIELNAELLIVDDRRARDLAETMGLRITGVAGVLLEAKKRALINEIKPLLDALSQSGSFRLSRAFYEATLRSAGE
jgi:predicted nucleic acid-binding protein